MQPNLNSSPMSPDKLARTAQAAGYRLEVPQDPFLAEQGFFHLYNQFDILAHTARPLEVLHFLRMHSPQGVKYE